MKKKYQVFISSTYSDLKSERQAAVESVLRAGHMPAGMELFSAGNESQLEIIKRWIEESDIYMLLLGGRYGSIEPKSKLSYTEIEYRYALELDKPVFALIMDESALNKKVKSEGKNVLELDNTDKFKEFKTFVMSRICRYFKDSTEIKLGVMESLLDIQSRFTLNGWVKSSEMPDVNGLLTEINDLREKNKALTDASKSIKSTKSSGDSNKFGDYTFDELKKLLTNEALTIPASLTTTGKAITSNVFKVFTEQNPTFALGISNSPYSATESTKYFIRNIIPPLMTFELVEKIKATGGNSEKYQTSKVGHRFIAYYKAKGSKN